MSFEAEDDSDLSDLENEDDKGFKVGRTGIIFLVDSRQSMFSNRNGEIYFRSCIEACRRAMISRMIVPDSLMMGVILFGTKTVDKSLNPKGITTLLELSPPDIEAVKLLQNAVTENGLEEFSTKIGHSDDFILADALWFCSSSFSKCNTKLGNQRIIIFTNDWNPHSDSQSKQHQTRKKAEDLSQIGISLEVFFMGTSQDKIDKTFYQELLQIVNGDSGEWRIPDPVQGYDDILQYILKEDYKKRAIGKVKFNIGQGLTIGVSIYSFLRKADGPPKIKLYSRTNERVKSVRQQISMATGELMLPSDIKKMVTIGGRNIQFTAVDKKKLSQTMDPGFTLLGFKPANRVNFFDQYRPCSFIYPEEEIVEGSRLLFSALVNRTLERDKVAICWMTPRKVTNPRLVALFPQKEVLYENGNQAIPEGFHVIYLPFAEYIRDIPMEKSQTITEEQVQAAKNLISKLEFNYKANMFTNPKIQALENGIRALALEEAQPEKTEDLLESTFKSLSSKVELISARFLEEFPDLNSHPTKKKASSEFSSSQPRAKVQKQNEEDIDIDALASQGKIEKLKVDQLKNYLKTKGVTVTGLKKADLINLVYKTVKKGKH